MRVLVASRGDRPDDFAWTRDGEIVVIGSVCSNPSCGCDRSFTGNETRKGTTVAMSCEMDVDPQALALRIAAGFHGRGWLRLSKSEQRAAVAESIDSIRDMERLALSVPVGHPARLSDCSGVV